MHSYGNNKASEKDCCKKPPGMDLLTTNKSVSHHMSETGMEKSLGGASKADLAKGHTGGGKANNVMGPYMVDSLESWG